MSHSISYGTLQFSFKSHQGYRMQEHPNYSDIFNCKPYCCANDNRNLPVDAMFCGKPTGYSRKNHFNFKPITSDRTQFLISCRLKMKTQRKFHDILSKFSCSAQLNW
ncbi:hypothetical protein Ahia01_000006000 [Argonauta hians]